MKAVFLKCRAFDMLVIPEGMLRLVHVKVDSIFRGGEFRILTDTRVHKALIPVLAVVIISIGEEFVSSDCGPYVPTTHRGCTTIL